LRQHFSGKLRNMVAAAFDFRALPLHDRERLHTEQEPQTIVIIEAAVYDTALES